MEGIKGIQFAKIWTQDTMGEKGLEGWLKN
jgi:hypothetical protein